MKAFLSHSSKDKPLVTKVFEILGSKVAWLDSAEIDNGDRIPDKVNEGLEKATHFILFWSHNSSESNWVKAELNAAFIKTMSDKCKFMIFQLDETKLPTLYQPYKYDNVDAKDLNFSAEKIAACILSNASNTVSKNRFVNRTMEIGNIETAISQTVKLVIIHGILGIGKSSLAKRAIEWVFGSQIKPVVIDFYKIKSLAELSINLSYILEQNIPEVYSCEDELYTDIQRLLEIASCKKIPIIFKDVKSWLNDNGEPNKDLLFVISKIISADIFVNLPVFITSTRYISLHYDTEYFLQFKLNGINIEHISTIIKDNLLPSFSGFDYSKNIEFSSMLCGYPLGAKLAANLISNNGYDYYLEQPIKINQLKIGLAKELISRTTISKECTEYLKIIALCKSSLRNTEYIELFKEYSAEKIAELSDEAFFAGLIYFDDACYKLEHIVEDYYYDLAFNSPTRKTLVSQLEKYLVNKLNQSKTTSSLSSYLRLLPLTMHILTLNNNFKDAFNLRKDMFSTLISTMWDQYNHRNYEDSFETAKYIIDNEPNCEEAEYVMALCYIRFENYGKAKLLIQKLIKAYGASYKYNYALGRIEKYNSNYENALKYFQLALDKNEKHISSMRESAECYYYLSEYEKAQKFINRSKQFDDSNVYIALLESRILIKLGYIDKSLNIIESESLLIDDPSQISFRKGRIYDEIGNSNKAIELYEEALEYNSNQYDAQLCLLNHLISKDSNCIDNIDNLIKKLKGKRRYILLNIKARCLGYYGKQEDEALSILDSVEQKYIDKQWFAVKLQLLKKIRDSHLSAGRNILAKDYDEKITELESTFFKHYNESINKESFLLPDA